MTMTMNNEIHKLHADIQEAAKALLLEVPDRSITWNDNPIFCNEKVLAAYDRVRAEGYRFQYPVVIVNRMSGNLR